MRQDWALAPQSKIKELDPARLRWWASVTDVRLAGSVPCNVVLSSPARDLEVYLVVGDIDNILDAQILDWDCKSRSLRARPWLYRRRKTPCGVV